MSSFEVMDVVLAYDRRKMYKARILRIQKIGNSCKYFIHFDQWARRFDTWIDESLVARVGDEKRIALIKDPPVKVVKGKKGKLDKVLREDKEEKDKLALEKEQKEKGLKSPRKLGRPAKSASSSSSSSSSSSVVEEAGTVEPATSSPAKKSRHCADVIDLEKDKLNRKRRKELSLQELVDEDDEIAAAKLQMPFPLKKHLLDEWKLVCHESDTVKRLLKLPKAPGLTVKSVIKEFVAFKKAKLDTDNNSAKDQKSQITKYEELFVGVELYFNRALPTVLLYRQEREQYDMLVSEAVVQASAVETGGRLITPSEIYGAEHLLRFFVRLPKLLGNVFLSSTDINPILAKFAELLKFLGRAQGMQKNYDITEYVPVVEAMEYLKAHAEDLKAQPEVAEGEEDLVLCMPTTSKPNSKPKKLKKKKKNFE